MSAAQNPLVITHLKDVTLVHVKTHDLRQEPLMTPIRAEFVKLVDANDRKQIIVDLSTVRFASSRFLGILAELAGKAKKNSTWLALCGLRPELRKPAELVGLGKMCSFFDSEDAAMSARPQTL